MRRAEDGAALVEFAPLLPVFMLFIGLAVEGGRTVWAYQTTITGMRDATYYLSRVVGSDACTSAAATSCWDETLARIVRTVLSGETLLPAADSIESVTSALNCIEGDYCGGAVPVATVTTTVSVSDSTRILG